MHAAGNIVQCVWVDMGGLRKGVDSENCDLRSFKSMTLMGPFLLGFFSPIILICLVQSPYLVHLRVFPYVQVHLGTKMGSSKEAFG